MLKGLISKVMGKVASGKGKTAVVLGAMAALCATSAFAFTEPVTGDLFFELYDLVVDQLLGGAAGMIIAVIMVASAFIMFGLGRGAILVPTLLLMAGAAIFFLKSIVLSFGYSLDPNMVAQASNAVSKLL